MALRDGALEVPGETVTDPVAYTLALAAAAQRGRRRDPHRRPRRGHRAREPAPAGWAATSCCDVAVNCAGLGADDVARLVGDDELRRSTRARASSSSSTAIALDRILLPVPTKRTKGVLVFPTIDGKVVAGPTAIDQDDKEDWSVRPEARAEVLRQGRARCCPRSTAPSPIASYAGLRPAGAAASTT